MTSNLELPEMFQKIAQDNFPQSNQPDTQSPLPQTTTAQLEQANAAIAALAKEYPIWAARDIVKMNQALQDARTVSGAERDRLIRKELFKIAHNAKGQGATFGYPLITQIGEHLCRYIERIPEFQNDEILIIRDHVNAMDTILKEKLTGDGGETGQELLNQLINT